MLLQNFRQNDNFKIYNNFKNEVQNYLPNNIDTLVDNLSNITGVFYGIILETIIDFYDESKINQISEKFNYKLGKLKSNYFIQKYNNETYSTISIIKVIIFSIYNSSPEFSFKILKLTQDESEIEITGYDRYFRICKDLNISQYIKWPAQISFFKGISDGLNLNNEINYNLIQLDNDGKTKCIYKITKQ